MASPSRRPRSARPSGEVTETWPGERPTSSGPTTRRRSRRLCSSHSISTTLPKRTVPSEGAVSVTRTLSSVAVTSATSWSSVFFVSSSSASRRSSSSRARVAKSAWWPSGVIGRSSPGSARTGTRPGVELSSVSSLVNAFDMKAAYDAGPRHDTGTGFVIFVMWVGDVAHMTKPRQIVSRSPPITSALMLPSLIEVVGRRARARARAPLRPARFRALCGWPSARFDARCSPWDTRCPSRPARPR